MAETGNQIPLTDISRTVESPTTSTIYVPTQDGGVLFQRVRRQEKVDEMFDVFPHHWFLVMADLPKDSLCLLSHHEKITAHGPYALLIPPFSLLHWQFLKPALIEFQSLVYPIPYPPEFPQSACVFPLPVDQRPRTALEIKNILSQNPPLTVVEKTETYNPLAVKLKKAIDRQFTKDKDIADYATDLNITRDALSKYFRRCYGLSPMDYRNHLRLSQALLAMLFEPKSVHEASRQAGFKTLRNFNRQFAKFASFQPSKLRSK